MKSFGNSLAIAILALSLSPALLAAGPDGPPNYRVFAVCDTVSGPSALHIDIKKSPDNDVVEASVAAQQGSTRYWTNYTISGFELDQGRDPICEAYQFEAAKNRELGIELITVCFERRDNGTYAGSVRQVFEGEETVERRLNCTYR